MTRHDPFDRLLDEWMQEGSEVAPRDILESVLLAVPSTRQRWRILAGGRFTMLSSPIRLGAGLAAALVIALAGMTILGGLGRSQTGTSTPSPQTPGPSRASLTPSQAISSPAPSPTTRITGTVQIFRGGVSAGATYTTSNFTPAFTFAGAADWNVDSENDRHAWFNHAGRSYFGIIVPAKVIAVGGMVEDVPTDLAGWIATRSDFAVTRSRPISIGGINGTSIEGSIRPGSKFNRGNAINIACYQARDCAFENGDELGFYKDDRFQIVVLDVRGTPLLLAINAGPAMWGHDQKILETFLASIQFP